MSDKKAKMARAKEMLEKEFISTETSYVAGLETLIDVYKKPLLALQKKIKVTGDDVKSMFSNVESIHQLHIILLDRFRKNPKEVVKILHNHASYFKIYTQYLSGYDKALQTMDSLGKNKKFQEFLVNQREGGEGRGACLDIMSYLITPVQRIPRYEMLVREILKNTEDGDASKELIEKTYNQVRSIASHINEQKREVENFTKLIKIQNGIRGLDFALFKPSRHLIKEGVLHVQRNRERRKERMVFLFSDILLWTNIKSEYKGHIEVQDSKLIEEEDGEDAEVKFTLVSKGNMLHITCDLEWQKKEWVNSIQKMMNKELEIAASPQGRSNGSMNAFREEPQKCKNCRQDRWKGADYCIHCGTPFAPSDPPKLPSSPPPPKPKTPPTRPRGPSAPSIHPFSQSSRLPRRGGMLEAKARASLGLLSLTVPPQPDERPPEEDVSPRSVPSPRSLSPRSARAPSTPAPARPKMPGGQYAKKEENKGDGLLAKTKEDLVDIIHQKDKKIAELEAKIKSLSSRSPSPSGNKSNLTSYSINTKKNPIKGSKHASASKEDKKTFKSPRNIKSKVGTVKPITGISKTPPPKRRTSSKLGHNASNSVTVAPPSTARDTGISKKRSVSQKPRRSSIGSSATTTTKTKPHRSRTPRARAPYKSKLSMKPQMLSRKPGNNVAIGNTNRPGTATKKSEAKARGRMALKKKRDYLNAIKVGGPVKYQEKDGIARFVGLVHFRAGIWVGIELKQKEGKHNGTVKGRRYFRCKPGYGVLVPAANVVTD
ncbi:hypothetical protein AAMO2058_000163600 [Amorphochlora amoebiformis]